MIRREALEKRRTPSMTGTTVLQELAEFAIKESKRQGVDFLTVLGRTVHSLRDRIADGEVSQPKEVEDGEMLLALWKQGRVETQNIPLDRNEIVRAIEQMLDKIDVLDRAGLPASDLLPPEGPYCGAFNERLVARAYDPSTAKLSAAHAARLIAQTKNRLAEKGLILDGVLSQSASTVLVATTHGTWQEYRSTRAGFATYAFDEREAHRRGEDRIISAFAYGGGHGINDIRIKPLVQELIEKCELQRGTVKWNPYTHFSNFTGEQYFDVIVEPPFIGTILTWLLAYGGFNGKHYLLGKSFLSEKLGERVFGNNITIWDDPYNPKGLIAPFDAEGVPKQKFLLVKNGVMQNICCDTTLAKKVGLPRSTGHAIPASVATAWGAGPENVYVKGGNASIKDMIRESKWPTIWITKVHYMGMKHFQTGTMTGTAQHGVFLVANGEVVGPVENLRFEMVIPDALNRVTHLGEPQLIGGMLGGDEPYIVPTMRIEGFRFIGATPRTK